MAPVFSVRLLVTFSFLSCVFFLIIIFGRIILFTWGGGGGGEGGTKYFERFEELK